MTEKDAEEEIAHEKVDKEVKNCDIACKIGEKKDER